VKDLGEANSQRTSESDLLVDLCELAKLADVQLSASDSPQLKAELEALLASVQRLQAVELKAGEPPVPDPVRRADEPRAGRRGEILRRAKAIEKDHIVVDEG